MSLKQLFLILLGGSLAFIYSCKEIGAVPEFQYEFNDFDDIEIEEVDTASLAVADIEIVEGSVGNAAGDNLAANVESDPATAAAAAAAVDNAVSADQQTFWNSQTPESVEADIESGNADLGTQLTSAITSFQNDPVLSQFIPSVVLPTGGRLSGRVENTAEFLEIIQIISGIDDDVDDCRKAAQDAFNLVKKGFDDKLVSEKAKIKTRYDGEIKKLTDKAVVLRTAATTRHTTRKTAYKATFDTFKANITSALNNGVITAAQASSLNLVNIMIYGFMVSSSNQMLASENTVVTDLVSAETVKLNTANTKLISDATANYNKALKEAQAKLTTSQNACHNQGSNSGG